MLIVNKNIILWLTIVSIILMAVWSPEATRWQVIRFLILLNGISLLVLWGAIRLRLYYHHRDIEQIISLLAPLYTDIKKPYMSSILHKKQITNPQSQSYLITTDFESSSAYHRFELYHNDTVYEFITHTDHTQIPALSAVIISYLKKDIPYERIYEDIRILHK